MRNVYPRRFDDDGSAVTLDVHGCTVDDALDLARRALRAAHRRGRQRVVVIHGASSSYRATGARTIKTELERLTGEGAFSTWATGVHWSGDGGQCTFWLPIGLSPDPARLSIDDVVRP